MDFDKKEKLIMKMHLEKFNTRTFDEFDFCAFMIFIREHLGSQYEYLRDIADFVAHRRRNQGIASNAISGAIANGYELETHRKIVRGYKGIDSLKWRDEIKQFGKEYGLMVDDQLLFEISLCVMSILQFSTHKDKQGHMATVFLLQTDDGQLEACTHENRETSPSIVYFVLKDVSFISSDSGPIEDAVVAIRSTNGELMLLNENGERIV